jgi:hypothetical protein
MLQTYPRWFSRSLYVLMALAILIRLFYWHYTDRTWEDALITVLHSENAARGLGLTHLQPAGEPPLHGFTSPLSVLIPLIGDLVHVGWGLPFIKLVSVFCGAIAVWLGARISQVIGLPPALALTAAAFLAFEHHQILWGMAGMETEVVTVAYLASIYAMQRGTQWQKGLSFGFCMLARPDAAIWVAIAFGVELWRARKSGNWRGLIPVVAGFVLLYAPWIIFTIAYYGSPVPNTIYAKSFGYRGDEFHFRGPHKFMRAYNQLYQVLASLGPAYFGNGRLTSLWDHRTVFAIMFVLGVIGTVIAVRRRHPATLLLFAFAVSYTLYLFLGAPIVFGWYTAPVAAAAVICCLYGLWHLMDRAPAASRTRIAALVGIVYIAAIISILPETFRSDKAIQQYVENGGRKQLGLYIGRVSLPTDTVGTESLGYVGYYSGRVIYDYPGLCSREVVHYTRTHPHGRNLLDMMNTLRPTYLVLRPMEYKDDNGVIRYPWITQDYDLVRVFRVPDQGRMKILHPENNIDLEFDLFRAKGAPFRSPDPPANQQGSIPSAVAFTPDS